jgi:tetratricopeptide (TPR) repeat protein
MREDEIFAAAFDGVFYNAAKAGCFLFNFVHILPAINTLNMIAQTQPIKALLANGDTAPALEQIAALTQPGGGDAHRAALLLRASLADVDLQSTRGLLEPDAAMQQRNRITFGALRLLDELESGQPAPEPVLADLQREFLREQPATAGPQDNDRTDLAGAQITADDGADVLIGQGHTVNKKVYTAWGRRQFLIVLAVLLVIIIAAVYGGRWFGAKQDAAYASMQDIKAELAVMADLNSDLRARLEANGGAIENLVAKGMAALRQEDYGTAIRYLEQAAVDAPAGTIYENIGYAYEQLGQAEKARQNFERARQINPNLARVRSFAVLKGKRVNLLAVENGAVLLAASHGELIQLIDKDPDLVTFSAQNFAVFGFLEKRQARFDQINYLVPSANTFNFPTFELSYANDSPTGEFTRIGDFTIQNMLLTETPFQEFKFAPVTARYVKIRLLGQTYSGYAGEIQLMGQLQ